MKESFDDLDRSSRQGLSEEQWKLVSEVIPYIGAIYKLSLHKKRIVVANSTTGEVVLDTDIPSFQALLVAEKATRAYRFSLAENEDLEDSKEHVGQRKV